MICEEQWAACFLEEATNGRFFEISFGLPDWNVACLLSPQVGYHFYRTRARVFSEHTQLKVVS